MATRSKPHLIHLLGDAGECLKEGGQMHHGVVGVLCGEEALTSLHHLTKHELHIRLAHEETTRLEREEREGGLGLLL